VNTILIIYIQYIKKNGLLKYNAIIYK